MERNFQEGNVVFDREGLLKRLMGDNELVGVVLDSFLSDIPDRIELLRQAVNEKDLPNIILQSHVIKGAAGNVGAVSVSNIARIMESDAREEKGDDMEGLIEKLEMEFEVFERTISQEN